MKKIVGFGTLLILVLAVLLTGCNDSVGKAYVASLEPMCKTWKKQCDAGKKPACQELKSCIDVYTKAEVDEKLMSLVNDVITGPTIEQKIKVNIKNVLDSCYYLERPNIQNDTETCDNICKQDNSDSVCLFAHRVNYNTNLSVDQSRLWSCETQGSYENEEGWENIVQCVCCHS